MEITDAAVVAVAAVVVDTYEKKHYLIYNIQSFKNCSLRKIQTVKF